MLDFNSSKVNLSDFGYWCFLLLNIPFILYSKSKKIESVQIFHLAFMQYTPTINSTGSCCFQTTKDINDCGDHPASSIKHPARISILLRRQYKAAKQTENPYNFSGVCFPVAYHRQRISNNSHNCQIRKLKPQVRQV